jgi:hypothetical protein
VFSDAQYLDAPGACTPGSAIGTSFAKKSAIKLVGVTLMAFLVRIPELASDIELTFHEMQQQALSSCRRVRYNHACPLIYLATKNESDIVTELRLG